MNRPERYRFQFILSDRTFFVRDEQELSLIFELLATTENREALHWNTIMSLDEQLLGIVQTHTGLMRCIRTLSNKNRFLFFLKIADILPNLIQSAEGLARLLASIPEDVDQEKLMKMLRRKGICAIVSRPKELGKVLEWATPPTELMVINLLGGDFVRALIASSKDFYNILYFMHATTKRAFVELVGWDFFIARVFSADDFFYALKAVEINDTNTFLEYFPPESIRKLITSEQSFHEYLMKLSFDKQNLLLQHLGYVPNAYNSCA